MKNTHLAKNERNNKIKELRKKGWSQKRIANEYNISIQRVSEILKRFKIKKLLAKKHGKVI